MPDRYGTFLGRSLTSPLNWALLVGQAEKHPARDSPGKGGASALLNIATAGAPQGVLRSRT